MKSNKLYWILGGVCLVNLLGHALCLPMMPDQVPIHWNWAGVADGFGPKWSSLALGLLPVGLLLLAMALPRIDPKGENFAKFRPIWNGVVLAMVLFGCAVGWLSELAVFGIVKDGSGASGLLVGGGLGILFILLGNYMPRIKQNYTFGCRTPWALADEHNWNRTQRMGGFIFIVIGTACLISGVFAGALGFSGTFFVLMGTTLLGCVWIYLYSFLVFKGLMK